MSKPVTSSTVDMKTLVENIDPETIEDRQPIVYQWANGRQDREKKDPYAD